MLEKKIYNDYVEALKRKDKDKVEFLSFLRGELINQAKSQRKESLDDPAVLEVLKKLKKRVLESKDFALKSQRQELIDKVEREITTLDEYLPVPLPKEEVGRIIDEVIKKVEASSIKDMGKVMKLSLERLAQRADSKEVSQIVKDKLSHS